jgi:hypothetical protein
MDAVLVAAYALHDYLEDGNELHLISNQGEVCGGVTPTPWAEGSLLRSYMLKVNMTITLVPVDGNFSLINRSMVRVL